MTGTRYRTDFVGVPLVKSAKIMAEIKVAVKSGVLQGN
jgi:hypothetical protein